MFIQELKGPWIDHPFWKKAFKLQDVSELRKLKSSVVKEVVIDTSKGLDVESESAEISQNSDSNIVVLDQQTQDSVKPNAPVQKRISIEEEHERAKLIISESREAVVSMFTDARMGKAVSAEFAMPLVEEISSSVSRNEGALISLVRLKSQDDYTYMHSVAVCALMVSLARELNLSEREIKQAGLAGLLHDIGKAAIPLDILNKPGSLNDNEFNLIKMHPEHGHAMLLEGNITDPVALDVVLNHHEKIDGTGYPNKLNGDQISLYAKMGAVCDVYDAITSNRPYKAGWEPGVSLQRMAQWTNHFDTNVFKAFVKSVGIYPIGSTVILKSGRLGVVVDQNSKSLLTPMVKVFFSTKSRTRIPTELIDLSKREVNDKITGHEDPVVWGVTDVNKLWKE